MGLIDTACFIFVFVRLSGPAVEEAETEQCNEMKKKLI